MSTSSLPQPVQIPGSARDAATRTKPSKVRDAANADRFDERSLVESARHDANAFAQLYRHYVDRIHGYAFRRTQSVALAEDVTAATFEKALRNLHRYRWREPGIGPWLFRIASNELVDQQRRLAKEQRMHQHLEAGQVTAFAGAATGGEDAWASGELDAGLRAALDAISPRYQRALGLRFLADLSNEEAAAAMGVSRSTMAVLVHRARAALRKQLTAHEGGAR